MTHTLASEQTYWRVKANQQGYSWSNIYCYLSDKLPSKLPHREIYYLKSKFTSKTRTMTSFMGSSLFLN